MRKTFDLTGMQFGNYKVIKRVESKYNRARWLCECKCGKRVLHYTCELRSNKVKQCPACHNKERGRNALEDLSGRRYGKLLVLNLVDVSKDDKFEKNWAYNCLCDCGNKTIKTRTQLLTRKKVSCGCDYHKDGRSFERLYGIYKGMCDRCENQNIDAYRLYGERGIKVCGEWSGFDGYDNFKKWSLNNGYSDELSIDRIDNNGNYEPNNCRWATQYEQSNNTRRCRMLTYKGKTQTMTQWARETGLTVAAIRGRLKYSDDIEKILTTPIDTKYHHGKTPGTFVAKDR